MQDLMDFEDSPSPHLTPTTPAPAPTPEGPTSPKETEPPAAAESSSKNEPSSPPVGDGEGACEGDTSSESFVYVASTSRSSVKNGGGSDEPEETSLEVISSGEARASAGLGASLETTTTGKEVVLASVAARKSSLTPNAPEFKLDNSTPATPPPAPNKREFKVHPSIPPTTTTTIQYFIVHPPPGLPFPAPQPNIQAPCPRPPPPPQTRPTHSPYANPSPFPVAPSPYYTRWDPAHAPSPPPPFVYSPVLVPSPHPNAVPIVNPRASPTIANSPLPPRAVQDERGWYSVPLPEEMGMKILELEKQIRRLEKEVGEHKKEKEELRKSAESQKVKLGADAVEARGEVARLKKLYEGQKVAWHLIRESEQKLICQVEQLKVVNKQLETDIENLGTTNVKLQDRIQILEVRNEPIGYFSSASQVTKTDDSTVATWNLLDLDPVFIAVPTKELPARTTTPPQPVQPTTSTPPASEFDAPQPVAAPAPVDELQKVVEPEPAPSFSFPEDWQATPSPPHSVPPPEQITTSSPPSPDSPLVTINSEDRMNRFTESLKMPKPNQPDPSPPIPSPAPTSAFFTAEPAATPQSGWGTIEKKTSTRTASSGSWRDTSSQSRQVHERATSNGGGGGGGGASYASALGTASRRRPDMTNVDMILTGISNGTSTSPPRSSHVRSASLSISASTTATSLPSRPTFLPPISAATSSHTINATSSPATISSSYAPPTAISTPVSAPTTSRAAQVHPSRRALIQGGGHR